jgi:hypothetical protein
MPFDYLQEGSFDRNRQRQGLFGTAHVLCVGFRRLGTPEFLKLHSCNIQPLFQNPQAADDFYVI